MKSVRMDDDWYEPDYQLTPSTVQMQAVRGDKKPRPKRRIGFTLPKRAVKRKGSRRRSA